MRATNGSGAFVLTRNGIYGSFAADVAIDVPGVTFGAQLQVEVDTTTVVQTPNDIPAGFRISGATTLTILGQSLGGEFVITRNPNGSVTIAVTEPELPPPGRRPDHRRRQRPRRAACS